MEIMAVEDLNVKGMMESPSNSRNTASAAWRTFLSLLEYKCERGRQTGSDGQQNRSRFCDGVEHPFLRPRRCRSGTLRSHACGDYAPCEYLSIC